MKIRKKKNLLTIKKMQKINSLSAPAAIGPYSQAVVHNDMVFCSGQIPLNVEGNVVGDDIVVQTRQVLENLAAVLIEAGSRLDKVVKTTVFLTDMADFASFNEVYAKFFVGDVLPARSTVQVAALPKGVKVEVEAIACI